MQFLPCFYNRRSAREKGRLSGRRVKEGDQVAITMGHLWEGGWVGEVFSKEELKGG